MKLLDDPEETVIASVQLAREEPVEEVEEGEEAEEGAEPEAGGETAEASDAADESAGESNSEE